MEIPGYRIEGKIAEGGMASVYRALQESLQRPVALKLLNESGDPGFSQRFLEEGRIVAALRHPGIITLYDIGIAGSLHFISMELVEGGDLESRIGKGLKPGQALAILRQLATTLDYVHGQGVVHRDIKPGNILFRNGNEPLLSDFGIAKQLNIDLKLTHKDIALGSPYYLSPEQSQGKKVDGRSDIYSLGILLFEMLTGKQPFKGKTPIDTILQHVHDPLPQLKKSLQQYQPLLERMTAKEPKNRFRNCAALLTALDALEEPSEEGKPPATRSPQMVAEQSSLGQENQKTRSGRHLRPWLMIGLIFLTFLMVDGPQRLLALAGLTRPDSSRQNVRIHWQGTGPVAIRQRLREARRCLEADQLTLPAEDNALGHFREVLRLEPDNLAARAGIEAIAKRYLELARTAHDRGQRVEALSYIRRGLMVLPGQRDLLNQRQSILQPIQDGMN